MPGPIFDPLNPNESPAMAYQRQLDKQNSGFSHYLLFTQQTMVTLWTSENASSISGHEHKW